MASNLDKINIGTSRVGVSDLVTGTTTNTYVDIVDLLSAGYLGEKSFVLSNTDGANGLKFKMWVRSREGGEDHELFAEETLAAGATKLIQLKRWYARVTLYVKSAVDDTPATYQLDWAMLPGRE